MASYARMLDKRKKPTGEAIQRYLGEESFARLQALESFLKSNYNLQEELRFPFGNNYGWGYKYSHGRKLLCYVYFEEGAFTVTLQLTDECGAKIETLLPSLLPETRTIWENRYPSGEHGGWIHIRVLSDEMLSDVEKLVTCKLAPKKKAD